MSLEDLTTLTTTRRTIAKTGAKLAYAAPIVAASMKLSTGGAAAVSGGACTAASTCGGEPSACDGNVACSCGATADGSTACFQWNVAGTGGSCSASDPCPSGEACILATCVGDICQPLCFGADGIGSGAAPATGPNSN
jgi:hypothetical protein